jgi:hypothetical protein
MAGSWWWIGVIFPDFMKAPREAAVAIVQSHWMKRLSVASYLWDLISEAREARPIEVIFDGDLTSMNRGGFMWIAQPNFKTTAGSWYERVNTLVGSATKTSLRAQRGPCADQEDTVSRSETTGQRFWIQQAEQPDTPK